MLTISPNTPKRQRAAARSTVALLLALSSLTGCRGDGTTADTTVLAPASGNTATDAAMGEGIELKTTATREERQARSMSAAVGTQAAPRPPEPPMSRAQEAVAPGTMLVRTARASVAVDALEPAVTAVQRAVARYGATLGATTVRTGRNEEHQANLTIRVPNERFDSLIAGLGALGRVESVDVGAQDVGEEYVDVEARLANARRLEARFLDLLARRTGNLGEVLRVENELSRVRGEIERAEGRKRYLERSVALSTIDLLLHEPASISGAPPGRNPIAAAFATAWRYLIATVAFGIASLGVLIPVAVLLAAMVLLGRWWLRRAGERRVAGAG